MTPKEGISLGYIVYERCQRRQLSWTRFSTMVWGPSCYPNTNKQRRNIGVNDRGGGWRRVGGRAEHSSAPEPWKVQDRCALRTLPATAPDGTPTPPRSPPNFFASFPQVFTTCHISAKVRDIRAGCMATWKFHGLGSWKTFSGALLELVASIVNCGLLTHRRTFGSYLPG